MLSSLKLRGHHDSGRFNSVVKLQHAPGSQVTPFSEKASGYLQYFPFVSKLVPGSSWCDFFHPDFHPVGHTPLSDVFFSTKQLSLFVELLRVFAKVFILHTKPALVLWFRQMLFEPTKVQPLRFPVRKTLRGKH